MDQVTIVIVGFRRAVGEAGTILLHCDRTGIEIVFSDFLPITPILIWR
jgi:hypothetical protein